MNYNYDVFVSYNRQDENFVEFLIEVFKKYKITFFLDKADLKIYDKLDANIKKNVSNSRYLLSLISPAYLSSYWCLFEAIEAIQGQNIELKFLPIFLRYTPKDPQFNEDYVIDRLAELNTEIENFEIKLIKNKAYELSSKIDKLNFVKTNLPKIFNQSHINIYPVFDLYNQKSVLNNLERLVNYLQPEANAIFNSVELTYNPNVDYEFKKPVINTVPQIKWSINIGKVKWKNNIIILGNDIYIGTGGTTLNVSDEKDGVYCLDFNTGRIKWFSPSSVDANQIYYTNGLVIFGCNNGDLYCISAKDGILKWKVSIDSPIFSKPFSLHGSSDFAEKVFIISYSGDIYFINIIDGSIINAWSLGHNVRSNALLDFDGSVYSNENAIYISCEDGHIVKLRYDILNKQLIIVWKTLYKYPDKFENSGESDCRFYASPLLFSNQIIQVFVRQTYFDYPAVLSINKDDGSVRWIGNDTDKKYGSFGNLRSQPLIINNDILFADAYSNSLVCLNAETGEYLWHVNTGRVSFEQWSSPIFYKDCIFIARHEGHLSKIEYSTRKKEWSMYLGEHADSGVVIDSNDIEIEKEQIWWDLSKGYAIYSTPIINKNHLLIGTDEGYLYCIRNII